MQLWPWGVVLVAAVIVLQVPLTYWLSRYFEREAESVTDPPDFPAGGARDRPPGVCPRCGAENDPTFTYCRHCVAPLQAARR